MIGSLKVEKNVLNTRNQSIDVIKIIAMSLIVDLHTTWTFSSELAFFVHNLGVIAIPLFFMVSGYLLIGRKKVTYKYSLKKIFNILKFVFFIVGITWAIHYSFSWWNFNDFIFNFFGAFIHMGYFSVFWYFGAMIVIYLLYPLINVLYRKKNLYFLAFFIIAIIQNCMFLSNVIGIGESGVPLTFRLWNWIFYFMLGGFIQNFSLDRNTLLNFLVILTISTLLIMNWLDPYLHTHGVGLFYSCPIVIAFACSVFLFLLTFYYKDNPLIKEFSNLFLPVYAIHPIVIIYTYKLRHWLWTIDFGCIIYWLTVLLLTCIISFIILKIPFIKLIFKL